MLRHHLEQITLFHQASLFTQVGVCLKTPKNPTTTVAHIRKFKSQVFQKENEKVKLRSEKLPIYHPHVIQAVPLSATTSVLSHIIFRATNCKSIKWMFRMHITALLSYSTADFPVCLFAALLPEAALISFMSVHKSLHRNGKPGSYKIQLYLPWSFFFQPHPPALNNPRFKTLMPYPNHPEVQLAFVKSV